MASTELQALRVYGKKRVMLMVGYTTTIRRSQTFVAGGGVNFAPYQQPQSEALGQDRTVSQGDTNGLRGATLLSQNADPDYASFEEAEAAFLKLLRRSGVQPEWTWEQAMRSIIKDPQYRALKDSKDRKAAFEKYIVEVRLQEKDRAKERMTKLRNDFNIML